MADEQDNQQRAARFAPRDRQAEPGTRRVRASLLFLGLGILLTSGTVLWLGLFNQQDEIRLEISDLKVDETGDVELTGAVYRGQTARGEPFEITANVAREREDGVVDLSSPTAQLRRAQYRIVRPDVHGPASGVADEHGWDGDERRGVVGDEAPRDGRRTQPHSVGRLNGDKVHVAIRKCEASKRDVGLRRGLVSAVHGCTISNVSRSHSARASAARCRPQGGSLHEQAR